MEQLYNKEQKVLVTIKNHNNDTFYGIYDTISDNYYLLTPDLEFAERMLDPTFTPTNFSILTFDR